MDSSSGLQPKLSETLKIYFEINTEAKREWCSFYTLLFPVFIFVYQYYEYNY